MLLSVSCYCSFFVVGFSLLLFTIRCLSFDDVDAPFTQCSVLMPTTHSHIHTKSKVCNGHRVYIVVYARNITARV